METHTTMSSLKVMESNAAIYVPEVKNFVEKKLTENINSDKYLKLKHCTKTLNSFNPKKENWKCKFCRLCKFLFFDVGM